VADLWDTAAFGVGSPAETAQQPSGMSDLVGGLYNYFGGLAKRAIGNSQTALDTGNYNPAPVVEAAMLPMGTGAIAGVPVKGAETVLGSGPIRAYHGSPHDFDRFDLSKIGTGEGAQAYGHGLYFAENEGVAKSYRDALAGNVPLVGGKTADISNPEHVAATFLSQYKTPAAAIKELDDTLSWSAANPQFSPPKEHLAAAQKAKEIIASGRELPQAGPNPGSMYEVNINADPARMLPWDEDITRSPQVAEAIRSIVPSDRLKSYDHTMKVGVSGSDVYRDFVPGRAEQASALLNEAGIPGIKYLDQGSRSAGDGSRNYVVFNDKLIDIMRKYGIALPGGAAAADFYTTRSQEPAI
jgi:hypothetical protein